MPIAPRYLEKLGLLGAITGALSATASTATAAMLHGTGPICVGFVDVDGDGSDEYQVHYTYTGTDYGARIMGQTSATAKVARAYTYRYTQIRVFGVGEVCSTVASTTAFWMSSGLLLRPGTPAYVKIKFGCGCGTCSGWIKFDAGSICVDEWATETDCGQILTGQTAPTKVELMVGGQ